MLLQGLLDGGNLGLTVTILDFSLGPQASKSSDGIVFAVLGQEPTGRARDEESEGNDH